MHFVSFTRFKQCIHQVDLLQVWSILAQNILARSPQKLLNGRSFTDSGAKLYTDRVHAPAKSKEHDHA
jgi:hypothetical protein